MARILLSIFSSALITASPTLGAEHEITASNKTLPIPGEVFRMNGHDAFVILPPNAKANIPIFHIHGNKDTTVPLEENSAKLIARYLTLGGSAKLVVSEGQGHNMWQGFFKSEELTSFVIASALGQKSKFWE